MMLHLKYVRTKKHLLFMPAEEEIGIENLVISSRMAGAASLMKSGEFAFCGGKHGGGWHHLNLQHCFLLPKRRL